MKNDRAHIAMLFLCAFLWGTTFVAQSMGAGRLGPFTYLAGRSVLGFVFLLGVIRVLDTLAVRQGRPRAPASPQEKKALVKAGVLCGTLLFLASSCQQIGIGATTTAKAGFITALYVVLVPVYGCFLGRRPQPRVWACVVVAVIGLYLLTMRRGGFSLSVGDGWVLACAFLFTFQIMTVDHYCTRVDGVRLSCIQFMTVSVWSGVCAVVLEHPAWRQILSAAGPIAYAGILSSGVAYTLQIVGQKGVEPAIASMVMCLESVFSAVAGWVVLHEGMSARELCGAALMFAAILFAQTDWRALLAHRSNAESSAAAE